MPAADAAGKPIALAETQDVSQESRKPMAAQSSMDTLFQIGLFRVAVSRAEQNMGRELYTDQVALSSWLETLRRLGAMSTVYQKAMSAAADVWGGVRTWLTNALTATEQALAIKAKPHDRDGHNLAVNLFGVAGECVGQARRRIQSHQQDVIKSVAAAEMAAFKIKGIDSSNVVAAVEKLCASDRDTFQKLTAQALTAECVHGLDELTNARDNKNDVDRCLISRNVASYFLIFRVLYPNLWPERDARRLLNSVRELWEVMAPGHLRDSVAHRIDALKEILDDATFHAQVTMAMADAGHLPPLGELDGYGAYVSRKAKKLGVQLAS